MTKAILVVSFGTTYPETRKKTIEACEERIRQEFPDYEIYRAFTSGVVRRRIRINEGIEIPDVSQALMEIRDQGIREVYIQPLHVILGSEYEKVLKQSEAFQSSFEVLKIGLPLLASIEDYESLKEILLAKYNHFGQGVATVLMGHGSEHHNFAAYSALDHMLLDSSVFIGCVESYPPVEQIEVRLRQKGISKVHLAPLMLVAGDHATNDMSADEEGSWYRYFSEKGYQVETHLEGLGENENVQDLYIEHLNRIVR